MKLSKYFSKLDIKPQGITLLFLPFFLAFFSNFISNKIYEKFVYEYINKIELVDTAHLEKIHGIVQKANQEKLMSSELISLLNSTSSNQTKISLPPLENIVPQGNFSEKVEVEDTKQKIDLKIQAVYLSDKTKFAIINGKIYKEGDFDVSFKVLKIEKNGIQIETTSKERIWLDLN